MPNLDIYGANYAISNLTMILGGVIQHRDCIILDWPNYCNVGDHMIWLGQKIILKKFLNKKIIYQSSYHNCNFDILNENKNSTILCTGGGNFGDLYPQHQQFREKIVETFPNREVIFLPQTIYYNDSNNLIKTQNKLNVCNNVKIFARDIPSLNIAKTITNQINVYLGIDSAFALQIIVPRILRFMKAYKKQPLYLIRQDKESETSNIIKNDNSIIIDWIEDDSLDHFLSIQEVMSIINHCNLCELIDSEQEIQSLIYFIRAISLFSRAEHVTTDRLHAYILANIMGIKCYFYNNSYGKNKNFHETWMKDDDFVKLKQ